jgi:CRP-like cAMP-binding protein
VREQERIHISNTILAELPKEIYDQLLQVMEPITLHFGHTLYEPKAQIQKVDFPNDSLISLLSSIDSGRGAEVGVLGFEGVLGFPLAMDVGTSALLAVVQGTGGAMRMSATTFQRALEDHPVLNKAVLRFSHSLMTQVAQTAACNRFHLVGQRLARWLLLTQDRLKRPEFRLTHEFLGMMLGVRRVGVSEAARILQNNKLIRYSRGTINILDRPGLLAATCSCYEAVNGANGADTKAKKKTAKRSKARPT